MLIIIVFTLLISAPSRGAELIKSRKNIIRSTTHEKRKTRDARWWIKLPETKILILAIFPRGRNDNDELRKLTMGTNEIIKTYADDKNIFYMNINKIFIDQDRVLHKKVMRDFLHPNESMYPKWAEAIVPKIEQLMQ